MIECTSIMPLSTVIRRESSLLRLSNIVPPNVKDQCLAQTVVLYKHRYHERYVVNGIHEASTKAI